MSDLNKVMLIGRMVKDPEVKSMPNGKGVCSFTIATNKSYKDSTGKKIESVDFHNIVAFGGIVSVISQYCKKGSQLYVEGSLATRSWEDQTGQKKYKTEVIVSSIQLLGSSLNNRISNSENEQPVQEEKSEFKVEDNTEYANIQEIPF